MSKIASVGAAVAATLLFLSCNPSNPKFAFKHAEKRGRLESNGLRFVIMPDATTENVEVDVRYEVGAKEDPIGKAGLAHLAEHMMFQQKPDGPDTKPLMHFIGQMSIGFNAFTNNDTTHYFVYGHRDQLDSLLKVEAMRLHYRCETVTEQEFLRERDVVRNEIRGGFRTTEGQLYPKTLAAVYPDNHAYEQSVGGDDMQLTNIQFKDACDFLDNYYVPERATVIVSGGVDVDTAVESIKKWFGPLKKRPGGQLRKVEPVKIQKQQKTTIEADIERPWVTVSWALPDATTPQGELAGFGVWSAFGEAAFNADEYECATGAFADTWGGRYAPVFVMGLELRSMNRLDECLDFIWKAAKKAHRGWDFGSWAALEEVKNRRKASFISGMESLTARNGQMGEMVQFTRDFDFDSSDMYLFHALDKIGKFDQEGVGKAVKGLLDPDRAHIVVFKPNKEGIKGDRRSDYKFSAKSHDKKEAPEVDPADARRPIKMAAELKTLSTATRFTLGNGMRVVLLPTDVFPVISAQLIFDVGDASTPDNPLLAKSAARFLQSNKENEATGRTGVGISCGTTLDHTICSARGISIYLDVVIKGLERRIRAGEYSQESVESWQKNMKLQYKLKRPQLELEFDRQQLTAVYGPDHPYTKTGVFNPGAVGKVGYDALVSFSRKHYSAANATLVVTGAFDPKQAESLIRDNFGAWESGHKDKPIGRDPFKRTGPLFIGVVGDEDDPHIDVAIMYQSPAGRDGQHAARMVLSSMLNERMGDIRYKLGATYGTYAFRADRLGPSFYTMGGAVDAPRAAEAIKAMRDGIDSLRKGTDFDVTFVRARKKLIQNLLGVGDSKESISVAGRLGEIARFGLEANYYNQLLQQIAAVSLAQLKALIATELDPSLEAMVLLGDRPQVTKAFAESGIKDVKIVEPDYK